MTHAFRTGRKDIPSKLAALGRFGNFKPETEQAIRTQRVESNPILDEMMRAWREFEFDELTTGYSRAADFVRTLQCSSQDITGFSLMLGLFKDEKDFDQKAGFFLSALVNRSPDREFVIPTGHLDAKLFALGNRNMKELLIIGSVGNCLGYGMRAGSITVKGDAGDFAGESIISGTITIEGDAGDNVGHGMKGGTIKVEGNADGLFGSGISGGEIWLGGEHRGLGLGKKAGRIYQRGELIWQEGDEP